MRGAPQGVGAVQELVGRCTPVRAGKRNVRACVPRSQPTTRGVGFPGIQLGANSAEDSTVILIIVNLLFVTMCHTL